MLRVHEQNIEHYRRLLRTKLSEVETHFIERRLSRERFAIEMLKFMTRGETSPKTDLFGKATLRTPS
ncbi:hypothetical protein SAMN05444164_3917 [Bradyrhizobium erythrophlei]|uniref:Uncharacterized protein n=1 Tax=Bradyrhizobium erythrophlei TaxID=1437360 RepID=A0A1H4YH19_9BRAD|nr:hypothetical protein SAMN05444164_3917 [Bradyrhizobium erythrophlei]